MQHSNTWIPTLNNLREQRSYLEGLLAKTVTTLNALRDRQTRTQRILSTNPAPRTRRKKIQQDRWRTSKTIQNCENEEKIILDCMEVCDTNIRTLEAIVYVPRSSWHSTECYSSNSYLESDATSPDWRGWTDDVVVSPFEQTRTGPLPLDDIAPDTTAGYAEAQFRRLSTLPLQLPSDRKSINLIAPPNSAYTEFTLSPEAATFKPSTGYQKLPVRQLTRELDKLTISGFLASKRKGSYLRRRFSDEAVAFGRSPSTSGPTPTRMGSRSSWPGQSTLAESEDVKGSAGKARLKRCSSI